MKKSSTLSITAILCFLVNSYGQPLFKVDLDTKVNHSSLILEGKVVAQKSFWNPQHTMIFTSNKVEVYKTFKGQIVEDTVEVLTQGGNVGLDYISTSDLLTLEKGQTGIFFCNPNSISLRTPGSERELFDVYSSSQGFIRYNHNNTTASAPFIHYSNILKDLYTDIQKKTNAHFKVINAKFSTVHPSVLKVMAGPSITSFSPATVTGGTVQDNTNNLLTINGTGFGASPSASAAVIFDEADDGPGGATYSVAYNSPLIVSWTNTQIKVHVPTHAGTGNLQVSDASANVATAPGTLTVFYGILDGSFTIGATNVVKESNLMNTNGSGGYTILYSTATAGSGINITTDPALATFKRALTTWKEDAGYNVLEGGNTTTQLVSPNDGVNAIMYDNLNTGTSPLANGVLAVCYFYASMCSNTAFAAQRTGFDIVIRNPAVSTGSANFDMGPCPPNSSDYTQVDMETTLLHELGHSLGLSHVNMDFQGSAIGQLNPGALMNWALVNSVRRSSPDNSAYSGAIYQITPQGNSYGACGLFASEMTPLTAITESKDNCPVSFPSTAIASGTSVNFDLVHTTANISSDPAYNQVNCDGSGAALTNNAYYALMTGGSGGSLIINITNYTTNPAAIASCSQIYAGIPTTGIRFALYQVNSCPSGQSFPTPVYCSTFTANGSLPAITGLTANTSYLLYVDGIENTKATFTLTLSGTVVLPINLTDFHGQVLNEYNELFWTADQLVNVDKVTIQKSADGINFIDFGETNTLANIRNGNINDPSPFIKTYYRLSISNKDGHKDFSKTISLERKEKSLFTIYPNPAKDLLQVQIATADNSSLLKFNLYNSLGQLVRTIELLPGSQVLSVPVKELTRGLYQACLYSNGNKILMQKVMLQ